VKPISLYDLWLHGVLRIHSSWAKPDALSGMGQSWKLGNTAGKGGVVSGGAFVFHLHLF